MELQLATTGGVNVETTKTPSARSQSIFTEIESDLLASEVYQTAIVNLQSIAGDTLEAAQNLVQALGREAIRLTFQQIAQNYHVVPNTIKRKVVPIRGRDGEMMSVEDTPVKKPSKFVNTPPTQENPCAEASAETSTETISLKPKTEQPSSKTAASSARSLFPRRITKAQRIKMLIEERNQVCRQIGKTLKEARKAQALSIGELHSKTLVQEFCIKALEEGRVEQLPEDIYLRGFIRRLAYALSLDGNSLAQSLPKPPKEQEDVVPSWQKSRTNVMKFTVETPTSFQMYAGYTALVAGTVSGLAWMSANNQHTEAVNLEMDTQPTTNEISTSDKYSSDRIVAEDISQAEIAPPEMAN